MSEEEHLPDEVRQFVSNYVDSVAELEGLFLMCADAASWDAMSLAKRLYIEPRAAAAVLTTLHRRGLLAAEGERFRYAPSSHALRTLVARVATLYPRFLIPIARLIHAKPPAAVKGFADAFKLRDHT